MSESIPYTMTSDSLSAFVNNKQVVIRKGDDHFDLIVEAIKQENWAEVAKLVDKAEAIAKYGGDSFEVKDGVIKIDGEEIPPVLTTRILEFMKDKIDANRLILFWRSLKKNPNHEAVKDLYAFLEKNGHPITEDGCFIAYKRVQEDFTSVHDRKTMNAVGTEVTMPREECDSNRDKTCSTGLHVANFNYAKSFYAGGRLLNVKVNPEDVVAIPVDYDQEKMRVCKYFIVSETEEEYRKPYVDTSDITQNDDDYDDDYDDDDYDDDYDNDAAEEEEGADAEEELSSGEIQEALDRNEGAVQQTAEELGIHRSTLYRLRKKHGLL